jgi:hypothetical protein
MNMFHYQRLVNQKALEKEEFNELAFSGPAQSYRSNGHTDPV